MIDYSEKRTYILNGELIHIIKVKNLPEQKGKPKEKLVTFVNLANNIESTVKIIENSNSDLLHGAVKTIDSTDFFKMWMHWNNAMNRDDEYKYILEHAQRVLNSLFLQKIELHGSGKFEDYDLRNLVEMYNFVYRDTNRTLEDIIDIFDGGYYYHRVYDEDQKKQYDLNVEFGKIIQSEVKKEINKEILDMIKASAQKGEKND